MVKQEYHQYFLKNKFYVMRLFLQANHHNKKLIDKFCFDCSISGGKLISESNETIYLAWYPIDEMPSSATWDMAMVKDLALGQKAVTFDRGVPGRLVDAETLLSRMPENIGIPF